MLRVTNQQLKWSYNMIKEQAYCHLRFKGFKVDVEVINL